MDDIISIVVAFFIGQVAGGFIVWLWLHERRTRIIIHTPESIRASLEDDIRRLQ